MLDYLQNDKIIDLLALKNEKLSKSYYKPFEAFLEQLSLIL